MIGVERAGVLGAEVAQGAVRAGGAASTVLRLRRE